MTRVIVGGVEIVASPGSRMSYDADTDTLEIGAMVQERPKTLRIAGPKKGASDAEPGEMSHATLLRKVIGVLKAADGPMAGMFITMKCLGKGSPVKHQQHLRILLDDLVTEGKVVTTVENNRKRYELVEE